MNGTEHYMMLGSPRGLSMDPINAPESAPVPDSQSLVVEPERTRLLAPTWHTVVLIVVLLAFSALGAIAQHPVANKGGRIPQYLTTMAWEWILTGYVIWGVKKSGTTLGQLIGGKWKQFEDFLLDVAIAVGFLFVSWIVLGALAYAIGFAKQSNVEAARKQLEFMIPQSTLDIVIAVLLALTAGFCEEVIFRGYLQRQFGLMAKNAWIGIALAAVAFGASHGYEGWQRMIIIAVFGAMFGVVAHYAKSLRPGMMTHALHDSIALVALKFVKMVK